MSDAALEFVMLYEYLLSRQEAGADPEDLLAALREAEDDMTAKGAKPSLTNYLGKVQPTIGIMG